MNCLRQFGRISFHNRRCLSQFSSVNIFDNKIKRLQLNRALSDSESNIYDYVKDEVAYRVADRVFDIKRKFPVIVDLGSYKGLIGANLYDVCLTNGLVFVFDFSIIQDTVQCIVHCSSSLKSLESIKPRDDVQIEKLLMNEEDFCMEKNSVDMVISSLSLHWVNDLPKLFANVLYSLKEDGVFIGAMFGGQTLYELRCSLQMAETEREGGFGLHVSPFVTAQDIGGILNKVGFNMLTIDTDEIVVNYPTMFELMYDLKGMAENNAMLKGRTHINKDTLIAAASIYNYFYHKTNEQNEEQSGVTATYQIFYFIGWKPHPSQPQPLNRGSANFSLKDIANLEKLMKEKK